MADRKKARPTILDRTNIRTIPNIANVYRRSQAKISASKPTSKKINLTVSEGLLVLAGPLAKTHHMSRDRFLSTMLNELLYDAFLRVNRHVLTLEPEPVLKRGMEDVDDQIPFE